MTSPVSALVLGLSYPGPDTLVRLRQAIEDLAPGRVVAELEHFVDAVSELTTGEWEELHTRTLDLSPLFVPYVGHVAWGESYRRGAFMAELQRAELDADVDQRGELPDHIVPILEYLDRVGQPLTELVEVLPGAIATMRRDLHKTEPDNPYRHLLAAAAAVVDERLQGASV